MIGAPRRPHSPEPVNFVQLKLIQPEDCGWSLSSQHVFPQTLSFPGLWPEPSPGHKPLLSPTHLSSLKVRPWMPGHGCQSQACSSLRPGQPLEAQKREEKTMKGFHSRRLPAVSSASKNACQRAKLPATDIWLEIWNPLSAGAAK